MSDPSFPAAFSLEGESALVTGGGTGLGLAIARCLAAAGARVAIAGRRKHVLESALASIGSGAAAVPGDLARLDGIPAILDAAERAAGPLSILVNNAGIQKKRSALETPDADLAEALGIHVASAYALAREAAWRMIRRRHGHVLFVSSMAALFGLPKLSAYAAAKGAVTSLVRSLALEWSADGVRVNAIVPGWIDEGMAAKSLEEDPVRKARVLGRTPAGRLGKPDDVGWAAVYLSSKAASFVTGASLVVDGGASVGF
ncbi:MAG: SDR family oxidoreductase [Planctomycetota bacterium]